jgi:hypothetical protein
VDVNCKKNIMATCVPFLRVPDIAQAIQWYESIGFKCTATNHVWEPDCELNWAELDWEGATFMLYPYDQQHISTIRDAGLYFKTDSIDGLAEKLRDVVKELDVEEKTFYGRKEIVFEDLNHFIITFSCEADSV